MLPQLMQLSTIEGNVTRSEQLGESRRVVVVTDDGTNEWALLDDDRVLAESEAGYSSATAALLDGLLYAECGQVLRGGQSLGDQWRLGHAPWVRHRVYQ